jgi:hypothetical protein
MAAVLVASGGCPQASRATEITRTNEWFVISALLTIEAGTGANGIDGVDDRLAR